MSTIGHPPSGGALIRECSNSIEELSNLIRELFHWIGELYNSIGELSHSIKELSNWIGELSNCTHIELYNWIGELCNWIKELCNWIGELSNSMRALCNWIRELCNWIRELCNWIREFSNQLKSSLINWVYVNLAFDTSKHQHGVTLFTTVSEKPPDFSHFLRRTWGYRGHILILKPPGPHGGICDNRTYGPCRCTLQVYGTPN